MQKYPLSFFCSSIFSHPQIILYLFPLPFFSNNRISLTWLLTFQAKSGVIFAALNDSSCPCVSHQWLDEAVSSVLEHSFVANPAVAQRLYISGTRSAVLHTYSLADCCNSYLSLRTSGGIGATKWLSSLSIYPQERQPGSRQAQAASVRTLMLLQRKQECVTVFPLVCAWEMGLCVVDGNQCVNDGRNIFGKPLWDDTRCV